MDISNFLSVLVVGMVGGFFNVYMGAGSLLTIPVLILLGLPPHIAIATNRLGVTGSDIAGWYKFHVKKMIDYSAAITIAVPSFMGAVLGANLLLVVNETILKKVVAVITLSLLGLIIMKPEAGILRSQEKIKGGQRFVAVIASFIVGIYGGFYGAGAGTFLFYILLLCYGKTFIESAGTHKLANLSFSVTAAAIFAYYGVINYVWAMPLFVGSFAGAYMSAYYADRIGNVFLRKLFLVVVFITVINLLI